MSHGSPAWKLFIERVDALVLSSLQHMICLELKAMLQILQRDKVTVITTVMTTQDTPAFDVRVHLISGGITCIPDVTCMSRDHLAHCAAGGMASSIEDVLRVLYDSAKRERIWISQRNKTVYLDV